jgi:hypothetical protein
MKSGRPQAFPILVSTQVFLLGKADSLRKGCYRKPIIFCFFHHTKAKLYRLCVYHELNNSEHCGLTTDNGYHMKMTEQNHNFTLKRIIFQKTACAK